MVCGGKGIHQFSVSPSDRHGGLESKPEGSEDHWSRVWLGSSVSSLFWKIWRGMEECVCPSLLKKASCEGGGISEREVQDSALKWGEEILI